MNQYCETKESCRDKMIRRIKGSILQIIGLFIGGVLGFVYYLKVGCSSGTCPITSNPFITILWGALTGYLIGDLFKKKKTINK